MILIFAYVCEIEAEAAKQRLIVALQQSVETADDCPFESAQDLFRTCAGYAMRRRTHYDRRLEAAVLACSPSPHHSKLHRSDPTPTTQQQI
jgi:hypothetical protein